MFMTLWLAGDSFFVVVVVFFSDCVPSGGAQEENAGA